MSQGHINGICVRHQRMLEAQNYNRLEETWATWRAEWERNHPVIVPPPDAAQPPPPPPDICTATKGNRQKCTKLAKIGGLCSIHHNVAVRRLEDNLVRPIIRQLHARFRLGDTPAAMTVYVNGVLPGLPERCQRELRQRLQLLIRNIYVQEVRNILNNGGTIEQVDAHIQVLVMDGSMTPLDAEDMMIYAAAEIQRIEWDRLHPPVPLRVWGRDQREAALAHDSQNVHTSEITQQMNDSIAILLAVNVPDTQNSTIKYITASWREQGHDVADINVVLGDVILWWNKKTIYNENDKLYKKMLRALWCIITGYKGELRAELEKRLWDECRDACVPYSVCTQGHIARLSNVMVGFDDAFVPPVPVGEILQQKMAAISAMDVEYDKQIEMASAVLAELRIPAADHQNWLAAF